MYRVSPLPAGISLLLALYPSSSSAQAKGGGARYQPAASVTQRVTAAAHDLGLHLRLQRPTRDASDIKLSDDEPRATTRQQPDSVLQHMTLPLQHGGEVQIDYLQIPGSRRPRVEAYEHRPARRRKGRAGLPQIEDDDAERTAKALLSLFGKPVAYKVAPNRQAPNEVSMWGVVEQPDGTTRLIQARGRRDASPKPTRADLEVLPMWLSARAAKPTQSRSKLPTRGTKLNRYLEDLAAASAETLPAPNDNPRPRPKPFAK